MTYSDPKYPIVNPSPSVDDCISSLRIRDYFVTLGLTSATWGYGYIFGKPYRLPNASTAAALGFTAAGMLILQDSRARLMGFKENQREVKLYGLHKEQVTNRGTYVGSRYPTANVSVNPVRPVPHFNNYK
jgi:hypothetical protein|eukprot:scaffold3524_cov279-Chaetoceros_neogracile.AAC.19